MREKLLFFRGALDYQRLSPGHVRDFHCCDSNERTVTLQSLGFVVYVKLFLWANATTENDGRAAFSTSPPPEQSCTCIAKNLSVRVRRRCMGASALGMSHAAQRQRRLAATCGENRNNEKTESPSSGPSLASYMAMILLLASCRTACPLLCPQSSCRHAIHSVCPPAPCATTCNTSGISIHPRRHALAVFVCLFFYFFTIILLPTPMYVLCLYGRKQHAPFGCFWVVFVYTKFCLDFDVKMEREDPKAPSFLAKPLPLFSFIISSF